MTGEENIDEEINTMEDLINRFKKGLDDDFEGFKNRLEHFKKVLMDYALAPKDFTIMGDAYLAFFQIPEEDQEIWLNGSMEEKINFISVLNKIEEQDELITRIIAFNNVLRYSGGYYRAPIYGMAADRMMYTLTGEGGFLTNLGYSPYVTPPKPQNNGEGVPVMENTEHMFM